jgi:hypothetical protein
MAYEWINARLALMYVSQRPDDFSARRRICEWAHRGLIASRADLFVTDGREQLDHLLGHTFWWAEGGEALSQDWELGHFSTWIDQKVSLQAFGVSFDFTALSDLVPADQKAEALRRISVVGHEEWISAHDLSRMLSEKLGSLHFEQAIVEACQLGQLAGRAARAKTTSRDDKAFAAKSSVWATMEWDIPLWFWRELVRPDHFQDWTLNKAHGDGLWQSKFVEVELQGVHFHKSGLINLGLGSMLDTIDPAPVDNRGRKPQYDWPAASAAVWGKILRGELIPETQAAIEKAFQAYLAKGDKEPSESTVRPHAKRIWEEYSKA